MQNSKISFRRKKVPLRILLHKILYSLIDEEVLFSKVDSLPESKKVQNWDSECMRFCTGFQRPGLLYYTNLPLLADEEFLSLKVCCELDFLVANSLLPCVVHLSMTEIVELALSAPSSGVPEMCTWA